MEENENIDYGSVFADIEVEKEFGSSDTPAPSGYEDIFSDITEEQDNLTEMEKIGKEMGIYPQEENGYDIINSNYSKKLELSDKQYQSKIKAIENSDAIEDKDAALSKVELDYINQKEDLYMSKIKRLKEVGVNAKEFGGESPLTKSEKLKKGMKSTDVGLGKFQGQLRVNVLSEMADVLGLEQTGTKIREAGEAQIEEAEAIEKAYKEKYGEEAFDMVQKVAEYAPDAVTSVLMGAKNIPQAIGETAVVYSRTGDTKEAAIAGITSLVGTKIINELFNVGTKEVATKFGKEIETLPVDEQANINKAFDALDDLGIENLDKETREKIVRKLDLTKPTEEIADSVKKELKDISTKEYDKVKMAYSKADEIAINSERKKLSIPEIRKMLNEKNILMDKKQNKALKEVFDLVDKNANGFEMEAVLQKLKEKNRAVKAKTGSNDSVLNTAISYVQAKQDDVLGDTYNEARKLSKEYNTKFKGIIEGEGSDLGERITEATTKEIRFNIGSRLLGDKIDPELAKDIKNLNLSTEAKGNLVKDILTTGMDKDDIASKESVNAIITNWNKSDKNGLKQLLGNKYKTVEKEIKALEVVQNTLDTAPVKESIKKNIINFMANASMVKISPVYAGKGIIYEGRNIATKIAFNKQRNVVRQRIKEISDSKVRDKVARAFNQAMIGYSSSELDKMFNEDQED